MAKEKYIKEVADEYKDKIPQKLYEALYAYKVEITDQGIKIRQLTKAKKYGNSYLKGERLWYENLQTILLRTRIYSE